MTQPTVTVWGAHPLPVAEAFWVTIGESRAPNPHSVTCQLYEKPPTPEGGGSGWEEVPLPKRPAVLIWRGRPLMVQKIEVIFAFIELDEPVENTEFQTLLHFYRPSDSGQPVPLRLSAHGNAVLGSSLSLNTTWPEEWVLTDIEWGEAVAGRLGNRIMQVLSLTFTEYREDERLTTEEQRKSVGKQVADIYQVKKNGESLGKIAELFHVHGGWKTLAEFQNPKLKDPRETRKGQNIKIPNQSGTTVGLVKYVH